MRLKRIRVAIHKLKERGFHEVVIATDHGFFMNTHAGAGDVCIKPAGNWIGIHDWCMLGDGAGDGNHLVVSAEKWAFAVTLRSSLYHIHWLLIAMACSITTAEYLCRNASCR